MAILTLADATTIRQRLGADADDMTDADLLAAPVVRPVEASVLRAYPDLDGTADPDAHTAVSILVAAAHLRAQPEIVQSRLGDSQVQYTPGEVDRMASEWEAGAWSLLSAIQTVDPVAFTGLLFSRIPGRR